MGARYLPHYDNEAEAMKILDALGGLANAADYYLPFDKVRARDPKPGDVCYCEILENEALGILMTDYRVAIIFEGSGLRALPFDFIKHGWRLDWA